MDYVGGKKFLDILRIKEVHRKNKIEFILPFLFLCKRNPVNDYESILECGAENLLI